MDTSKIYHDSDGNECSIWQMVRREPEWAANRIQEGERAIEKLASQQGDSPDCSDTSSRKLGIDEAMEVAELWRAGKMIGADANAVREALSDEIKRLRKRLKGINDAEA